MEKIQEFLLRAFVSGVLGAIAAPVATVAIMLLGVNYSQNLAVGLGTLIAIVLFFTPFMKNMAEDEVRGMAFKEAERKAYAKQEQEQIATYRKKIHR